MENEGIGGRTTFGGKNGPNGCGIFGHATQSVDGFRGERDQAPLAQELNGFGHPGIVGRKNSRLHAARV